MQKLISKESESDLIKIGLYQVVGGAIGILIILWGMYKNFSLPDFSILIYLFILLFFSYSIFCGALCLKERQNALQYSLINQVLQIFGFAIMGFAFKYVAGVYLTINIEMDTSLGIMFGVGISKFQFNFNAENNIFEIDVNLVAIFLIYWIDKLIRRIKEEVAIREASAIGTVGE
jgi:uncharacterized membrane protein YidH (DUF202 family)